MTEPVKLTQYSHGAGCGCKISPAILDEILKNQKPPKLFPNLLVGNDSNDDAAVYDLGNDQALISTTDFFMPIVDNPFDFGRIAATNALSDVYAMGGRPILAISILGWPINKISSSIANEVIRGANAICAEACIPLAGGHSIDSPEPIFGLSVNGIIDPKFIKKNSSAAIGDLIYITKPIGIGILTTASKKGLISEKDLSTAVKSMTTLNKIGTELSKLDTVSAMTDVTGFGLLGHLKEMAQGAGIKAHIQFSSVPLLPNLQSYIDQGCIPGGTTRNWDSYGKYVSGTNEQIRNILCDPQTSGGILFTIKKDGEAKFLNEIKALGDPQTSFSKIGEFVPLNENPDDFISVME